MSKLIFVSLILFTLSTSIHGENNLPGQTPLEQNESAQILADILPSPPLDQYDPEQALALIDMQNPKAHVYLMGEHHDRTDLLLPAYTKGAIDGNWHLLKEGFFDDMLNELANEALHMLGINNTVNQTAIETLRTGGLNIPHNSIMGLEDPQILVLTHEPELLKLMLSFLYDPLSATKYLNTIYKSKIRTYTALLKKMPTLLDFLKAHEHNLLFKYVLENKLPNLLELTENIAETNENHLRAFIEASYLILDAFHTLKLLPPQISDDDFNQLANLYLKFKEIRVFLEPTLQIEYMMDLVRIFEILNPLLTHGRNEVFAKNICNFLNEQHPQKPILVALGRNHLEGVSALLKVQNIPHTCVDLETMEAIEVTSENQSDAAFSHDEL